MSDSDARSNTKTAEAVEELALEIAEDVKQGRVLLAGDAAVHLFINVHDVSTPEEAVKVAIEHIVNNGFKDLYFVVTDKEADEEYLVRAGQLIDSLPEGDESAPVAP